MKVAICDDEKQIRDILSDTVRSVSEDIEIECYSNAESILSQSFDADILLLDIQMPGIDGMEAARKLRASGKNTVIVFVTAIAEQVFNAFDVGAFQYIVKPFNHKKVREIIDKAIIRTEEQTVSVKDNTDTQFIMVKSGGTNRKVVIREITYAEIFNRRIVIHMENKDKIEYYGRISDLENMLGTDFFRVHRAYLINFAYIRSYDSKYANVGEDEIPVARGKYQELIKAYLLYTTRRECL